MRRWLYPLVVLMLTWASPVGAGERVVRLTLKDGTKAEGAVVSEDDARIVIMEARAGGTIRQTRTIARRDIAELTELGAAELQQRAHQQAYDEVQRYQLIAANSYEAAYYTQVVERVFRPFLERYPDSPHAAEVSAQVDAWRAEFDRVRTGQVKYRGTWMDADAATRLYSQENSEQVLRQAQTLITQKQYAKAIGRLEALDTPEARSLKAEAYRQWVPALEAEQQLAAQQVQSAQERVNRAQSVAGSKPPRATLGAAKDLAEQRLGEKGRDVIAYNKAQQEAANATRDLSLAQARLTAAERELVRVQAWSGATGLVAAATGKPGPATVGPHSPHYVSVPADKEDWSNPSLLQNMWRFIQRYWVAAAVIVALGLWVLTRRLSK